MKENIGRLLILKESLKKESLFPGVYLIIDWTDDCAASCSRYTLHTVCGKFNLNKLALVYLERIQGEWFIL